ncbi:MAG: thiamine-phosphate kinase [Chloroflexi bacterium]|nr:thiamine-phosphate kinase [Chloroflexota bacterium]
MKVAELGEFALIDLLASTIAGYRDNQQKSWQQLITGIGEDAAAWHGDGAVQLATVDALVQNVHFRLEDVAWPDLGWKALAINLSDIAAMGGLPGYALVSLSLPPDTEVENVIALYHGMLELARTSGVAVIGGDTDSVPMVAITVTVLGYADRDKPLLLRSAARPGDLIAVTGYLGGAAAGLQMLKRGLRLDSEAAKALRKAFWRPQPRLTEGQLLVAQGVRAAIDISDGLISDLGHICMTSHVGARVEVDRVPVHPAAMTGFGAKALELALSGGEDYELLFTGSADVVEQVAKRAAVPVTVIGQITEKTGELALVDRSGRPFALAKGGWEHFTSIISQK